MVQTILTPVTAHTMGRQLSGSGQSPFFIDGAGNVCPVRWHGGLSRDDVPSVVG